MITDIVYQSKTDTQNIFKILSCPSLLNVPPQLGSPRGQLWTDPPTPTAAARCLCLTSLSNRFLFHYPDDWAGSTPSYGEDCLQEFVLCEKESDKMMCSRYLILACNCKCWTVGGALQKSRANDILWKHLHGYFAPLISIKLQWPPQ